MKQVIEKPGLTLSWEISAQDHGANVTEYVPDVPAILDFCARVFFANTLFEASIVTIRSMEHGVPLSLGFYYPANFVANGSWLLKILISGKVYCRWLKDADEAFGMLWTELNLGRARMIQIWSCSCACSDNEPVPGVEPSAFPFA